MKKITSLLFALMCLCSTALWAQPMDFGDPLITSADQLSSPFSDSSEGQNIGALCDMDFNTHWHSDYHNTKAGDLHWLQIQLPEVMEGNMVLWIKRRGNNCANDHPSKAVLTGSLTPDFAIEIPIDTLVLENAAAGLEFTTGTWTIPEPVKYIRFTPIDCQGTGAGFRIYWHAAEINLYQPGEYELCQKMMEDLLASYDEWLWGEDPNIGPEPGQYSDQEAFDAFLANLQYINQILYEEVERPSNEEITALVEQTREYFAKYRASKNEYKLPADGYYRIIANLDFYKDIDTGEKDEFDEPIVERTYMKKSMYALMDSTAGWHTLDLEDCRDVWYISRNEDNTVNMYNAATEMGFKSSGHPVGMTTKENALVMKFDWAGKEEVTYNEETKVRDILYLRANEWATSGTYMHMMSHSRGAGEGAKLTTWAATFEKGAPYESDKGTSEWWLEPVSDEEAQALIDAYAPIKNHDVLVLQYKELLAKAQTAMAVAQDFYKEGLITRNDQFSSPLTHATDGNINNLLDGNSNTHWHTIYNVVNVSGVHFLDISFDEPIEGEMYAWIQRRGTGGSNDNPTMVSIYGSNDESAKENYVDFNDPGEIATAEDTMALRAKTIEGWELIADSLSTPWANGVVEVTTDRFTLNTPYKYIRLVCEASQGPDYGTRGFFHMGGFQLFKPVGTPQIETMGEIGTNMQAELEKAANTADEDLTIDDLNRLTAAYEAFIAILNDPTEMRNTVAQYKGYPEMLVVGDNVGYWASDAEANALIEAINVANTYDKSGSYDQEKLDEYTANIIAAAETFMGAAKNISTDKWYRIQFPTEETYDKYGWSKGNTLNVTYDGGEYLFGALHGQYAAVAKYTDNEEYRGLIEVMGNEEMREGDYMYFTELDNITNEDAALFRFIAIGDSAYIIQNKASGLYINIQGTNSTEITMSLDPTTFQVNPIGYGSMLMAGKSLAGVAKTNLHGKKANHRLVSWSSAEPSSNSGLWLEEAGDVKENDATKTVTRDLIAGQIYPVCQPAAIKTVEGSDVSIYTVAGTYTEGEESYMALNVISETQPGVPYIAIVGTPEDYIEGEEVTAEPYQFEQAFTGFAAQADSINGLIGTYAAATAESGAVIFNKNTAETAEQKIVEDEEGNFSTFDNRSVKAYSAYLKFGYNQIDPAGEYDLVIQINGTPTIMDGIESTLESVAKSGTVYDMSGRQVKKNATLNDLKGLGRGIYILNGVKVMVK